MCIHKHATESIFVINYEVYTKKLGDDERSWSRSLTPYDPGPASRGWKSRPVEVTWEEKRLKFRA